MAGTPLNEARGRDAVMAGRRDPPVRADGRNGNASTRAMRGRDLIRLLVGTVLALAILRGGVAVWAPPASRRQNPTGS